MRVGILSDTHGDVGAWQLAMENFFHDLTENDLLLHAGDIFYNGVRNPVQQHYSPIQLCEKINTLSVPIIFSKGNCDSAVDLSALKQPVCQPYFFGVFDGIRVILTHGDACATQEEKISLAKQFKANLFISGHTHIGQIQSQDGILIFNPGSPSLSKRSDGRQTVGFLDTSKKILRLYDLYTKEILQEASF